jgi:hypothetical protein
VAGYVLFEPGRVYVPGNDGEGFQDPFPCELRGGESTVLCALSGCRAMETWSRVYQGNRS